MIERSPRGKKKNSMLRLNVKGERRIGLLKHKERKLTFIILMVEIAENIIQSVCIEEGNSSAKGKMRSDWRHGKLSSEGRELVALEGHPDLGIAHLIIISIETEEKVVEEEMGG